MITDEMLRTAAAKSSEMYVRHLEQSIDLEQQHNFSPGFERKIKRLTRKANHPLFYRSLQRVASVFLAIMLSGAIWLFFNVDARAAFLGWVREVYETYFVYRFQTELENDLPAELYYPSWLPEGYEEVSSNRSRNIVDIRYINTEGQGLIFGYSRNPDRVNWFVDKSVSSLKQVTVNGLPADLLLSNDPNTANTIIWVTSDHTAFFVSAHLPESDLIQIAEGVQEKIK